MSKNILIVCAALFSGGCYAQSQNAMWCDTIKDEMAVVQQQKDAGFKLENTMVFSKTSLPFKIRNFRIEMARVVYRTPDSGRAYLNSRQYYSDCMAAIN